MKTKLTLLLILLCGIAYAQPPFETRRGYIDTLSANNNSWISAVTNLAGSPTSSIDIGRSDLAFDSIYINYLINTNPLLTSRGGTGLSSFTAGDIPYYTSGTALSKLGIGANKTVLQSNGTIPVWQANLDIGTGTITSGAITSSGLLGVTVASGYAATFMDGNVGIGTATPAILLTLKTPTGSPATTPALRIYDADGIRYTDLYHYTGDDFNIVTSAGNIVLTGGRVSNTKTPEGEGWYGYRFTGANSASYLDFYRGGANQGLRFYQGTDLATAGASVYLFDDKNTSGRLTAASGNQNWMSLEPTILQTGTAGYTALNVNVTETGVGSGSKYLANLQVGSVNKWTVNNTGDLVTGTIHGLVMKADDVLINLFAGTDAGLSNTSGVDNIAIGHSALYSNLIGSQNVAVGRSALKANTASQNTAFGYTTLENTTTGATNVAVGTRALKTNTTGGGNVAIGVDALSKNIVGGGNTAVGGDALWWNTGHQNTGVGEQTLWYVDDGDKNVAIGRGAGAFVNLSSTVLKSLNNSTFVGEYTGATVDSLTNVTVIGNRAQATKDNQVVLGNDSVVETLLKGNVGIETTAPLAKLSINGGLHVGGDSDPGDNNALIDGSLTVTGEIIPSASIDGGVLVADSSAFTTTATRKAVYIAGMISTDKFAISIRNNIGDDTLPVAGDLLSYYAKTDSLIVLRAAGTTSGLKFSYIRIK